MSTQKRENWSSRLNFILASLGGALGLGAMWKLPYVMGQNGGGAFIALFVLFNFLVGYPLFTAELILGRQSQRGAVASFAKFAPNSNWPLVGWLALTCALLILSWYCVVSGWSIFYILLSLNDSFQGKSAKEIGETFYLFRGSGLLNTIFQAIFIGLNGLILYKGLAQGIEKWSKILMSILFIFLIGLSIYAFSLPGFAKAVEYVLYPNFSLITPKGVLTALSLALFTLSLGYGAMITYGSYMKPDDNIPQTALIVTTTNLVASILIAMTIFPIIFTFGFEPQSGEGLIFITLPYMFEQLPGSLILAVLFFSLLLFAALTSSIAFFEAIVATVSDLTKIKREIAVVIVCFCAFIVGLPVAIKDLIPDWKFIFSDDYMGTINGTIDWLLSLSALFTSLFVAFRMNKSHVKDGFFAFADKKTLAYTMWYWLVKVVVPLSILIVLLQRAQVLGKV